MDEENQLLTQLPKDILPNLKYTTQHESDAFVKNLLTTNLPKIDQNFDNEYYKNFLLLKHKVKNKKTKTEKIRKNKNYITRSEKNNLGIGKLHRNSFKYTDLIPLYQLWKKYIRDFLELDKYEKNKIPTALDKNWDYFSTLLIKADYHGAIFTVIRSTCPSLVGHTGICVMETQNTLYIVDQKNITRNIPKQPTVFQIQIDEIQLIIFGKYMKIRPAERSTKKIKNYIKPDL